MDHYQSDQVSLLLCGELVAAADSLMAIFFNNTGKVVPLLQVF
jgi:hypothetical protein